MDGDVPDEISELGKITPADQQATPHFEPKVQTQAFCECPTYSSLLYVLRSSLK